MSERTHYLVGVQVRTVGIGNFGFFSGVKTEAIVDVGNAVSETQAKETAIRRFAKSKRLNPILVAVTEVRQVSKAAEPKIDHDFSLENLATSIGAENAAICGCLTVKVRRA